jgi:hypothetical protein
MILLVEVFCRTRSRSPNASDHCLTLDTMTEDAYVTHGSLLLGEMGKDGVRAFSSKYIVAQMPPDIESTHLSRTIGQERCRACAS